MALKDKLMTLEDFKAVRDVDVASNSAQFTEIKADLGAVRSDIYAQVEISTWVEGKYINLTETPVKEIPNEVMTYAEVNCSEGDMFVINAIGAIGGRAWGFIDSANATISMASANATITDLTLIAPANAVKLIINNKGDGTTHGTCYKIGASLPDKIEYVSASLKDQVGIFEWVNGQYIDLTTDPVSLIPISNNIWKYTAIRCAAGDKFVINAVGGITPRAWGFIDSGNHILSVAESLVTVTDLELTAPANATKLIINDKSGGLSYKIGKNIASKLRTSIYNAKDYGCVGDKTTNDAPAIQAILNRIKNGSGGELYFPPGIYKIEACLIVYSNTTITLDKGAKLIRGANINFMFLSNCTDSTLAYNGIKNVTIRGGVIDIGTGFTQGACAAGFIHAQNILIEHVEILHNNAGYHMLDICGCKNVKVKDCYLHDPITSQSSGELIQFDGAGSRTQFPSTQLTEGAATFDGTPDVNIEVCGCVFELNSYSPAFGNHNNQRNKNIDIHDNVISGTAGDRGAVAFENAEGSWNHTTQVFIHHNIFEGCNIGFNFGVEADGKIYVRDNIFKGITTLKKNPNSPVGEFLNNIELV